MAYPNNTYSFGCYKDGMECWLTSVNAIGGVQIGRMDAPYAYEMLKWTQYEVVAGFEGQFICLKTTITIERSTKQEPWVEEPVNQTLPLCKDAENKMRKYTIENSPGWNRAFGENLMRLILRRLLDTASYPAWFCHHKREYQSFERVMHLPQ